MMFIEGIEEREEWTLNSKRRFEGDSVLAFVGSDSELDGLTQTYANNAPYPHLVIDGFLKEDLISQIQSEFPVVDDSHWVSLIHTNEKKYINQEPSSWGPMLKRVAEELMSQEFVDFLSELTGIQNLIVDPSFQGGGLAVSEPGGYLNIHADFTVHPYHRNWQRRLNLLLYLNEDWDSEYGGELELWSKDMKRCEKKVSPISNRALIFSTDLDSFHGHPEPLACPKDRQRRSLALYYFSDEVDPKVRSTEYRARPGDGFRSISIYFDKELLRSYDWLKRNLGFSDNFASRLLRWRSSWVKRIKRD
jgi:2OG-Fe(II) oxygenase superfamily